jgi:hypothetical protein
MVFFWAFYPAIDNQQKALQIKVKRVYPAFLG